MNQARTIALRLLNRIQGDRLTLDHLLKDFEDQIQQLSRPDRSLVHALVYGVLRWQGRLDYIIDQFTARSTKIDPLVRIILRLGLFQIQFLERIPSSAAVFTSVELAKENKRAWASGFVNGVLRQVIRKADQIIWPDPSRLPVDFMAAWHSLPQWMISRWMQRWGQQTTDLFCRTINTVPAITLRANTLQLSREQLMKAIGSEAESIQEALYSPEGLVLMHLKRALPEWPAFQNGWFQVQSEAAQLISHFVAPQPGDRVWDACAGLGTKTAHLAQLMHNQGHILATDLSASKLKSLEQDMARLGISNVSSAQCDLACPDPAFQPDRFDRILIDAPCSGLGVLQKNPDGKWRVKPSEIAGSGRKQIALLENAAPFLKIGGILIYSVCSLEPEENEQVIEGFLQKHPDFDIYDSALNNGAPDARAMTEKLLTPKGFLVTAPHLHQLDGFFAAALIRKFNKRI